MAVNFQGETWRYVEDQLNKFIGHNTAICISPDKTHEEIIRAQGAIQALKTILNLPQEPKLLAAYRKQ